MTGNPNTPRVTVNLTLDKLDELATFAAYLRAEPVDGGAAGFGIEGAVRIVRSLSREAWAAMGSPVVIPITLHNVRAESVTP